jgi:hypothetical protein
MHYGINPEIKCFSVFINLKVKNGHVTLQIIYMAADTPLLQFIGSSFMMSLMIIRHQLLNVVVIAEY